MAKIKWTYEYSETKAFNTLVSCEAGSLDLRQFPVDGLEKASRELLKIIGCKSVTLYFEFEQDN